jgi:hypothetical protein
MTSHYSWNLIIFVAVQEESISISNWFDTKKFSFDQNAKAPSWKPQIQYQWQEENGSDTTVERKKDTDLYQ